MTKQVQLRRGTSSEHLAFTGAVGEVTVDTTLDVLVVHDGVKLGGHYLVGTGYGATVSQGMVNKTFVGIGTTTTNGCALAAVGDAKIAGNLTLRGLDVIYEPPIVRQGTLTDTQIGDPAELLFITGIATDNIRPGYKVVNFNHIDLACVVAGIGISTIELSVIHFGVVGTLTTTFDFVNPTSGQSYLYDLELSHQAIIAETGITTAYVQNLFVNSGIVTDAGITTAYISDAYINSGIVTTLTVQTSYLTNANISAGIITSANIGNAYVNNLYGNIGLVTTITGTDLTYTNADIDNLYVTTGIVTTAGIESGRVVNLYATSGIVTTAGIQSGRVNNLFATTGIVTTAGIASAYVNDLYVGVGIGTTLGLKAGFIDSAFITSGIITTAYINTGIITTTGITSARVANFYANSGVVTTLTAQTSYFDTTYTSIGFSTFLYANTFAINAGIITSVGITTAIITTTGIQSGRVDNLFATSGIVTTAGISSAYVNDLYFNVGIGTTVGISSARVDNFFATSGIVTTAGISSARVDNFFATSGIVTTLNAEFSNTNTARIDVGIITTTHISTSYVNQQYVNSGFATSFDIRTAYVNSGFSTFFNVTGVSTVNTLNVTVGIASTVSSTGIAASNVYLNVGFATDLVVSDLTTTETFQSNVGLITNLTGTNLRYSGISTLGSATGVGTVTIGIGTTALFVDGSARITGVLSVGQGTIVLDGNNDSVSGISRLVATAGTVTNLVGNNLQYAGITTLNNVGVTTLAFVGFNTIGNQNKTVTIRTSNSGIASNYTLTLPAKLGTAGQLLGLTPDGTLGFTTNGAGLFESRYYVSAANGNDAYDGKALPVKSIKRAAQLASFDSFQIPGQRYLDAGDLLEANREFIKEESIAYVQFNYENIGVATIFPDFNANTWKVGIGSVVDALTYDIRFGGNSKSINVASTLRNSGTYTGEEVPLTFAIDYVKFLGQYVINNQTPPTLYQTAVSQTFDFTIIQDPENNNANYFHRSKDARNLIVGNRQEIIDKSLASVAVGVGSTFFFPGEVETNPRSRYYDAYKLIQINEQEIVDKAMASLAIGFPTGFYVPGPGIGSTTKDSRYYDAYRLIQINKSEIVATALTAINTLYPTLWSSGVSSAKCQRDLGYFVDAVSTDVFTGGNTYSRAFTRFYFDNVGAALSTGLVGEEQQSIYGFQQAGIQMRNAITNRLSIQNLGISSGPTSYTGTKVGAVGVASTAACTDVQNNITSLVGVVTAAIGAGSTSGLPTLNLGNFNLSVIGFGTTAGIWKCARDTAFFVEAVSTDVFTGGNNYTRRFAGFYFNNVGSPLVNGLVGEEAQSNYVFTSARNLMQSAVTNQLNSRDLTITADGYLTTTAAAGTASTTKTSTGGTTGQGYVSIANSGGLALGMPVFGTGIGSGAYVTGLGATFANLSKANTANTNGATITFGAVATLTFASQATAPFEVNQTITVSGVTPTGYNGNYVVTNCTTTTVSYANTTTGSQTVAGTVGSNLSSNSCANVRSTIAALSGIVTTVVAAGSTAGIGTTTNYGYFLVTPTYNVRNLTGISTLGIGISSVGIGTTTVVGGRKCARDLGYIVDAIAQDVSYGTNQHTIYATKKYFNGAGTLISNGVLGEESASVYAFRSLGTYAKQAVTNWLNYQDLTIQNDVSVGSTNKNPNVCANTRSNIDSLVGILTTALLSGSLVGIASTSIGGTDCADVRSAIVNYAGIVTTIIGFGTAAGPALSLPQTKSNPVCIIVEAGDYTEDNPIILYDDVAVVGDNLRNTIIRPLNAGKDLFRVRNGVYVTGFAMKDAVDAAGIPQSTFDYAVAFDDPTDPLTSRAGYATKTDKPTITRSPYIQNCSILSFLGGNGILVDGSKVLSPNVPLIAQEAEIPVVGDQPEQGKSMVAATFTMVSFGGIGWRTINDGYAQVVSCFQIFCRYGSLTQSGGYLSITNSATNFGFYALRSTGFSPNSFRFDRGRIAATGTSGGLTTLKVVGLGRSDQDLYVLRFFDNAGNDQSANFKAAPVVSEFIGTAVTTGGAVNIFNDTINIALHPFQNGDSLVYLGDEGVIPSRVIGGLVNQNQYYVKYIDSGSFQLAEDDSLSKIVDLTSVSTGIHTFQKNTQEFFAKEIIDRHNAYQSLTFPGTQTLNFVSGRTVTQTVAGGTAVGYAFTYNSSTRQLIVSVELSEGTRRNFAVTGGSNLTINDHSGSPISTSISAVAGISTYWSIQTKVDSTLAGGTIQGVQNLAENYRLHFHRPSIINSSSHTWEFSGSGIDYNALPQNGGKTVTKSEQVSERGGRVFSSGTNELGDFKIGDFITAFNRTGNIIFNNTVTIGTLDSIRLSLSGGVAVEEFSIDGDLGDNELGGPLNKRVSTQLAVRSFLNNRLGNFIDKLVSTNAIPNAIVQLNSIGQINADLIPPKTVNYYRALNVGGRTQLVNFIPATNLLSGDVVTEPIDSFVLVSDLIGQYLILNNASIYNFQNGDQVVSTTSAGGAVGIVTAPPTIGVNTTTLSFPNVGYGTTGLVRGVALTLKSLSGGSGYSAAGIYTGVRLDTSTGIGTGLTATITVSAAGTVSNVAINTGGFRFAANDILTLNDATPIGGRSGGSNFTVQVNTVETRLYLKLTNQQKFPGSSALSDYIADRNATGVSTNIGIGTTFSFTPTDIGVGGNVDFVNDRIVVGAGHTLQDGDPVIYRVTGGTVVSPLVSGDVYYVKRVGLTSVALYTSYALSTLKDLESSGTGTHTLTRPGIVTSTNQIVFKNHGFVTGDPVRITGNTPTGVTTGNFYFLGSITLNSFTLHETRAESLASVNGLSLNPVDLSAATNPVGIMTFTKQNVTYSATVNTSSNDPNNFSLLSTNSLDAANIVSGTISPTRLGSGSANNQTFLRGDSSYQKVVTAIGIGSTQPFDIQGYTSADFPAGGVGFTTYYGVVRLGLNRVQSTVDQFSTLGVARFKNSTFSIGVDGTVQIKNSAGGGDVDAVTLGGNNSAYHLDVTNHTGTVPITRGGTGLTGAPANGALLVGNGSAYTLTSTPTLQGLLTTQSILVSANQEIYFTSGTFGAERAGKIQFANNSLFLQYTTSLIGRNASGTNVFTLGNTGNAVFSGTLTSTTLTLNGSGSTTAAQLTINGATNNWIDFGTNGVATPAFTTRSLGTKIVLYTGLGAAAVDYALGIESGGLWRSVPTTTDFHKWYGGTTLSATLSGAGNFTATGTVTGTQLISNIAQGTAPLSVTSTTTVTNLRANYVTFGMLDNNDDYMNFRVMRNNNTVSNRDGMYIGYGNANSGDTRLYGGGNIANPVTIGNGGTLTATGTVTGTRLISNIAQGTAPLSVTSTTEVSNLNVQYLNGYSSATTNTGNTIVRRDASGNFNAGTITGTTIVGGTGTAIGGGGLVVNGTSTDDDSQLIIKKPSQSSFGLLTWNGQNYLSSNIYYVNAGWVHDAPSGNTNNQLFAFAPGSGVRWYASNNSTGSWNVASDLQLWNDSGVWQRPLANTLTLNTSGTGISGSTTFNNSGAATFTVTSNATSANTVSTIVARDGSGNFSAGTITATSHTVTGNLSAWNTTTPGTGVGGVHIGAASGTANAGPAITFGARDASSGGNAQAGIYINSDGSYGTRMYFATTDSYATGSRTAMSIDQAGVVNITRSNLIVAGTVTANSDIRLKTNIETISDALNKVLSLRGVTYDRIDSGERQIGVIAQEVEEVIPELVREYDGTKSVSYQNMVAVLIEAIKEQQVQINELRDEIKKLKGE